MTLEDMKPGGDARGMKGFRKLRLSCAMATRQGLKYIWIDTCCIDKTSSSELSEAINSMFRYYREAEVCYAYLSDVSCAEMSSILTSKETDFEKSLWWSRGWTLQELIAPKNLRFYNMEWGFLGTKADLKNIINRITKIPDSVLLGGDLADEPVSRKMSWVSTRQTTVPEDIAYCLLGVFGVNIPLLYGEGAENAFLRLQEAILKATDDESIFLWRSPEEEATRRPLWGILAKLPSYFSNSPDIRVPCNATMATSTPATLTGRGVSVELLTAPFPNDISESINCAVIFVNGGKGAHGILLQKLSYSGGQFARVGADILLNIDRSMRIINIKWPDRYSSRWDDGDFVASNHGDNSLGEPQALCFYVRQNPKPPSPTSTEAVGFCFDLEKSLPPEICVDDWSSRWSRWEHAQGKLANGSIYVLDFEGDHDLQPSLPSRNPLLQADVSWRSNVLGVLQLSDNTSDSLDRLALCVGVQRTSISLLDTPVSYPIPWCRVYDLRNINDNPDEILKNCSSPTYKLNLEVTRIEGSLEKRSQRSSRHLFQLFVELGVRYGQVYYLVKLARRAVRDPKRDETYTVAGSHPPTNFQNRHRRSDRQLKSDVIL